MYKIQWTEYSKQDYDNLNGSQKILIGKSLDRIKNAGMQAGQPCHKELAGCRRLKHRKAGLRVIFRESEESIEIIQIVAIGHRDKNEIYNIATQRILEEN